MKLIYFTPQSGQGRLQIIICQHGIANWHSEKAEKASGKNKNETGDYFPSKVNLQKLQKDDVKSSFLQINLFHIPFSRWLDHQWEIE